MKKNKQRRAFYVDVSEMPKTKAEQYLRKIVNRFKKTIKEQQ